LPGHLYGTRSELLATGEKNLVAAQPALAAGR
jgi:hypothetical protein